MIFLCNLTLWSLPSFQAAKLLFLSFFTSVAVTEHYQHFLCCQVVIVSTATYQGVSLIVKVISYLIVTHQSLVTSLVMMMNVYIFLLLILGLEKTFLSLVYILPIMSVCHKVAKY